MSLAATRPAVQSTAALAGIERVVPPRAGDVLGNYRLVTELGQGGMGTVYYAEHVSLPRRAAVKVLAPEISHDPDLVARFLDEAHAANAIGHPGIVDVLDQGSSGHSHYLVMELLEGETLGARLERTKRLDANEAVACLGQAADALAAAHRRGIVHRDLKPENLFLMRSPQGTRVKVLDFGIAKLTGQADMRRTRTGTVMGTPLYMSPEQCLGERDLDGRSDVYSLGVVAFEALTGRTPFVSDAVGRLIVAHTHQSPPSLISIERSVPPALESVVLRMLSKRREDRYATIADAREALEAALVPKVEATTRREGAPSREEIEHSQSRSVGTRLRDIIHARIAQDRLPLPSMPMVVLRALDLLRDVNVPLPRVAGEIERDPLLVARVLKLANSAALGAPISVTGLELAIGRMGERRLRMLLHECAAREVFTSRDPAVARSFQTVWEHCLAVGTLARELVDDPGLRDELYLAGLLHDIGKPVVGVLLLETERSLWDRLGVPWMGGSLWLKVVGDCHAQVGAALARRWRLPDAVTSAIESGLEGDDAGSRFSGWLTYAHRLAEAAGHRGGGQESASLMFDLERSRERMGGSIAREQIATSALGEVLAAPARRSSARETRPGRPRP